MKKITLLVFSSIICLSVYGQKTDYRDIPDSVKSIFNIQYEIPESFNFLDTLVAWKINDSKLSGFFYAPVMQSDDKSVLLLYAISPIFKPEMDASIIPDKAYFTDKNLYHRNRIMFELEDMLGTKDFNPNDYLSVLPEKKAQKWFNADSVLFFDVSPVKPYVFDRTYKYCTKVFISKKNSSTMMFVLYFTDDVKKRKQKYLSKLGKSIWYSNEGCSFNERRWFDWMGRGFCPSTQIVSHH